MHSILDTESEFDEPITEIPENLPSQKKPEKTKVLPIVLGSVCTSFLVIVLIVYFVVKQRRKSKILGSDEETKVSMRKLEKQSFVNDDECETKGRPPSFMYLGATGYDVKDDKIVEISTNPNNL